MTGKYIITELLKFENNDLIKLSRKIKMPTKKIRSILNETSNLPMSSLNRIRKVYKTKFPIDDWIKKFKPLDISVILINKTNQLKNSINEYNSNKIINSSRIIKTKVMEEKKLTNEVESSDLGVAEELSEFLSKLTKDLGNMARVSREIGISPWNVANIIKGNSYSSATYDLICSKYPEAKNYKTTKMTECKSAYGIVGKPIGSNKSKKSNSINNYSEIPGLLSSIITRDKLRSIDVANKTGLSESTVRRVKSNRYRINEKVFTKLVTAFPELSSIKFDTNKEVNAKSNTSSNKLPDNLLKFTLNKLIDIQKSSLDNNDMDKLSEVSFVINLGIKLMIREIIAIDFIPRFTKFQLKYKILDDSAYIELINQVCEMR